MTGTAKLRDNLHQIIDQIEDQATLRAVYTLLTPRLSESGLNKIHSVSGEALDQDQIDDLLEESEGDVEAGRTLSHQELKTHMQSWRKKQNVK